MIEYIETWGSYKTLTRYLILADSLDAEFYAYIDLDDLNYIGFINRPLSEYIKTDAKEAPVSSFTEITKLHRILYEDEYKRVQTILEEGRSNYELS